MNKGNLTANRQTLFKTTSHDYRLVTTFYVYFELTPSRLGRSMLECMEILSIAMTKGIRIYAVKGSWQLDDSIQSKIVAMAFSMAAEIERDLISQRTKEALKAKKAAGVKLGRPKGIGKSKLDPFRPEIESLLKNGSTKRFIAKRYNTSEANLHHWLKLRDIRA